MNTIRLLFLLACGASCAQAAASVLPPGAAWRGHAPAVLVGQWWQWLAGHENAPALDPKGRHCRLGQHGDVWFLAGTIYSGAARRTCYLPHGKALFFPLITVAYWPDPGEEGMTCEQSRSRVVFLNDSASHLHAELDGRPVPGVRRYRTAVAGCFDAAARLPAGKRVRPFAPTYADGYWLLLEPLPRGRHVLKFGGRYNWPGLKFGEATQDIEYELHVY